MAALTCRAEEGRRRSGLPFPARRRRLARPPPAARGCRRPPRSSCQPRLAVRPAVRVLGPDRLAAVRLAVRAQALELRLQGLTQRPAQRHQGAATGRGGRCGDQRHRGEAAGVAGAGRAAGKGERRRRRRQPLQLPGGLASGQWAGQCRWLAAESRAQGQGLGQRGRVGSPCCRRRCLRVPATLLAPPSPPLLASSLAQSGYATQAWGGVRGLGDSRGAYSSCGRQPSAG